MWSIARGIVLVFCASVTLSTLKVCAFDDPISLLGRIRWNYTAYEENLWTRSYENTTLEEIFADHNRFIETINKVFDASDVFYPNFNGSTSPSLIKNEVVVDAFLTNPYHVPVLNSVVILNAQVLDYWEKFSNLPSYNVSNMLDVLMDDAIPILQTALSTFWNSSTTLVYFNFLKDKSEACNDMGQDELAVYKLTEKYFTNTMAVQLKAYIMLQLSYLTKAAKDFVQFHKTARDQRITFNSQYTAFTQQTEQLLWNLSLNIWSCDDFSKNDSYTSLTNFIQGYVDNEINLNEDGSCMPYCSDLKQTKNYDCKPKTMCAAMKETRCEGTVRDCDYFGPTFTYCPNTNTGKSDRRINYVELSSGRFLGEENEACVQKFKANTFMKWLTTCRYCFCYCDTPGPDSDRHFSLRDITSNVNENKVISGVRIMKKNGIIHLTATERLLLPKAVLDESNRNLISNDNFTLTDPSVISGSDYFTMTYENRTLNLDTIVATTRDQVVTGIRFRVHSGAVHLEVRFSYFDEATGKLDLTAPSEWKSNTQNQRTSISAEHSDIPTRSIEPTIAMGSNDSDSIKFVPTSWVRDTAQTTVPFIDSILVETPEMEPLSGIGLFYKSQSGYGGYVAPRLVTQDNAAAAMRVRSATGVYGV